MRISYILTPSTLALTIGDGNYHINSSHKNYSKILDALKADVDADVMLDLIDLTKRIERHSLGLIQVFDDVITYDGKELRNYTTQRILQMLDQGFDITPMVRYLERERQNPSARAVNEMYRHFEVALNPITPEGLVVGWKAVDADYKDKHTHTIDNFIGAEPKRMNRNEVDDNCNEACSFGYHVGSLRYAKNYANSGDHVMKVLFDPADVVSVPLDSSSEKVRLVGYKVVAEDQSTIDQVVDESTYEDPEPEFDIGDDDFYDYDEHNN